MSRILRHPPSYARAEYDPNLQRVMLPRNASPYQKAHEYAHRAQQALETRAWRWHRRCMHAPYLCRLTRILIEWEAMRMALEGLDQIGLLDDAAKREAHAELRGYFWCLVR